ncbi:MAG: transglutaminase-like cysteine peptidase [Gammaproteobacteria bacterium]|nr:transglutaminase-like cysteine peptidase [Gammaproteobacteria bacterium]
MHPFRAPPLLAILLLLLATALAVADLTITSELLAKVEQRYGVAARQRLGALHNELQQLGNSSTLVQLKAVNAHFNSYIFRSDQEQWGRVEYWATPFELMAAGAGDCEDFAIAKYFALRSLGIDDDHLRLMYVRARTGNLNQAHMVLAYYPLADAEPLVLDNLVPEILPASARSDLQPVYSFNGRGLWQAKARGLGNKLVDSGEGGVPQWQDLLTRIERGE